MNMRINFNSQLYNPAFKANFTPSKKEIKSFVDSVSMNSDRSMAPSDKSAMDFTESGAIDPDIAARVSVGGSLESTAIATLMAGTNLELSGTGTALGMSGVNSMNLLPSTIENSFAPSIPSLVPFTMDCPYLFSVAALGQGMASIEGGISTINADDNKNSDPS